jgi:hypothetical protein
VEGRRRVPAAHLGDVAADGDALEGLELLVRRRLLFRDGAEGDLHALSSLIDRR